MLTAAKTGLTILNIFFYQKHLKKIFEGEMLITSQTTTPLQIFCELLLYSLVIFKSMKEADDTSKSNSECEWVKRFIQTHAGVSKFINPGAQHLSGQCYRARCDYLL